MCLLGSRNKENVFYDTPVKDYLALYSNGGSYTYSNHSKFQYTQTGWLRRGYILQTNYLTISIVVLKFVHLWTRDVNSPPQAPLAYYSYLPVTYPLEVEGSLSSGGYLTTYQRIRGQLRGWYLYITSRKFNLCC